MTKYSGPQPRFGKDFLFNWLSAPAASPEQEMERKLALAVLTHGKPTYQTQAFRYSRNDWEVEHAGRTICLTFQNFASPTGTQSAAYTLVVNNRKGNVLRGVHERTFLSNVPGDIEIGRQDELLSRNPATLRRLCQMAAGKKTTAVKPEAAALA